MLSLRYKTRKLDFICQGRRHSTDRKKDKEKVRERTRGMNLLFLSSNKTREALAIVDSTNRGMATMSLTVLLINPNNERETQKRMKISISRANIKIHNVCAVKEVAKQLMQNIRYEEDVKQIIRRILL